MIVLPFGITATIGFVLGGSISVPALALIGLLRGLLGL